MEILLIIMLAPLALMLGFGVICMLLDPRFWIAVLIIGTLLFLSLSFYQGSVVQHKAAVTLPELGCESCGKGGHVG